MLSLPWTLTAAGIVTALGLWAVTLGFAALLPRGTAVPMVAADLIAGVGFSIVLFGGLGHLLGRILRGTRRER
ncbi:MAG: hypothetical protein LDL44_11705 [Caenispirillum sp.]|nr:hypothetical protein [Caenispirillum sp.]